MGNKKTLRTFKYVVFLTLARVLFTPGYAIAAQEVPIGIGPLTVGGSATSLGISTGYLLSFSPWLQIGAQGYYQTTAAHGVSNRQMMLLIGPQFNFGGAFADAFTAQVGAAWRNAHTNSSPPEAVEDASGLGFGLLFGKRFPLGGSLAFHPMVGLISTGTTSFVLMPAQISLNF